MYATLVTTRTIRLHNYGYYIILPSSIGRILLYILLGAYNIKPLGHLGLSYSDLLVHVMYMYSIIIVIMHV